MRSVRPTRRGYTCRMPETPDFKQIAQLLAIDVGYGDQERTQVTRITEQLRLVWNARGAADLVKLEAELSGLMGVTAAGPYVKNLDRALKTLDR